MQLPKHPLSRLVLLWAIVFGALVRIYPVWSAGFPVNDGGLFYRMVQDLIVAKFHLPMYTTYNQLNIPFAYPPFPLYLAAFITQVLHISILDVVRWLPVLFSILTLPAVYWFARLLTDGETIAAFATLFFAFMPRAFEWLIMGGGLTRAPATLFFILFAGFLLKVFRDGDRKSILYAILCGGLILLSHPERSLHALTTAVFFLLFFARSKRGLIEAAIIGICVAILSSPWWAVSVARFGWEPILQAGKAGGDRALFWAPLLLLNFTDETIAITGILGVIGVMFLLARRQWFLPLWTLLSFLTDPRSAPHIVPLQFSILAAIAVTDVLLPRISSQPTEALDSKAGKYAVAYMLVVALVNGFIGAFTVSKIHLSAEEQQAFQWIAANVQGTNNFLLYPSELDIALSPLLEWFPALTDQTSLSTFQGREWLADRFHSDAYFASQDQWLACAQQEEACLADWIHNSGEHVEYVLIDTGMTGNTSSLALSLKSSPQYMLVYSDSQIQIFRRND